MAAIDLTQSTRERLLAAAIEVFRAEGYERARVQDIARTAGLTTGAIYANWKGKADLLLEAITAGSVAEVEALLSVASERPARELLEALGARMAFRQQDRPLLLEAVVAAERDPDLATMLRDLLDARHSRFAALLAKARADGAVDESLDLDALTRFCVTLALGSLVVRALALPTPEPGEWDTLITRLLDAIAPREER